MFAELGKSLLKRVAALAAGGVAVWLLYRTAA